MEASKKPHKKTTENRLSLHDMISSPRKRASSQPHSQDKGEYPKEILREKDKDKVQGGVTVPPKQKKKNPAGGSLRLPGMRRRGLTMQNPPSRSPWDQPPAKDT